MGVTSETFPRHGREELLEGGHPMPVNHLHRLFLLLRSLSGCGYRFESMYCYYVGAHTHCPLSFIIYGIIRHMTCTKSTRSLVCRLIANKAHPVYQSVDFIVVQRQSIEIYFVYIEVWVGPVCKQNAPRPVIPHVVPLQESISR